MGTQTLVPTGTVSSEWETKSPDSGTFHEKIDEGTASPNAEYVETSVAGATNVYSMEDSGVDVDTVTQITVNVYGYIDDAAGAAQLQVNVKLAAGTDITGSPIYMDGSNTPGNFSAYNTTPELVTQTLTGLSLTKAEVDGLTVTTILLDS